MHKSYKSSLFALLAAAAFATGAHADDLGKKTFETCVACHSMKAGENGTGPTLHKLIGRQAGSVEGFRFSGPIDISLAADESLSAGMVEVDSRSVKGVVSSNPALEIDGKRYPITKSRTVIGRGSDADITVDDSGTSRKHVEILWDGVRAQVHDLGSTNGSKLDGRPVTQAPLSPGQTISIGRTRIVFRVVQGAAPARADRSPSGPSGRSSEGFWDDRL